MAGIEPLEAVKTLKDRLITVQMHDMNEFSKNAHDVPWGTGQTQLTEIIEYLHRNEIKPVMFGLEYAHNWGKSLPAIKQSIGFFDTLSIELSNQHKAQ
jgi:hypothetical protein